MDERDRIVIREKLEGGMPVAELAEMMKVLNPQIKKIEEAMAMIAPISQQVRVPAVDPRMIEKAVKLGLTSHTDVIEREFRNQPPEVAHHLKMAAYNERMKVAYKNFDLIKNNIDEQLGSKAFNRAAALVSKNTIDTPIGRVRISGNAISHQFKDLVRLSTVPVPKQKPPITNAMRAASVKDYNKNSVDTALSKQTKEYVDGILSLTGNQRKAMNLPNVQGGNFLASLLAGNTIKKLIPKFSMKRQPLRLPSPSKRLMLPSGPSQTRIPSMGKLNLSRISEQIKAAIRREEQAMKNQIQRIQSSRSMVVSHPYRASKLTARPKPKVITVKPRIVSSTPQLMGKPSFGSRVVNKLKDWGKSIAVGGIGGAAYLGATYGSQAADVAINAWASGIAGMFPFASGGDTFPRVMAQSKTLKQNQVDAARRMELLRVRAQAGQRLADLKQTAMAQREEAARKASLPRLVYYPEKPLSLQQQRGFIHRIQKPRNYAGAGPTFQMKPRVREFDFQEALKEYTGAGYSQVHEYLLHGQEGYMAKYRNLHDTQEIIRALDSGLVNPVGSELIGRPFYSGLQGEKLNHFMAAKGKRSGNFEWTFPSYFSSSSALRDDDVRYSRAIADSFTSFDVNKRIVLQGINQPGEIGHWIGGNEQELLRPRNSTFHIGKPFMEEDVYGPLKIFPARRVAKMGGPIGLKSAGTTYTSVDDLHLPGTFTDYESNWQKILRDSYRRQVDSGSYRSNPSLIGWYTRNPTMFRRLYEMTGGTGNINKSVIQGYNKKYKTNLTDTFYPNPFAGAADKDQLTNNLVESFTDLHTYIQNNSLPFGKSTTLFRGITVDQKFGKSILDQITNPDLQGINLESLKDNALHNFTLNPSLASDYAIGDRKYKGYSGIMLRMLQKGDMQSVAYGNPDLFALLSAPSEYSLSSPAEDFHLSNRRGEKLGKVAIADVIRRPIRRASGGNTSGFIGGTGTTIQDSINAMMPPGYVADYDMVRALGAGNLSRIMQGSPMFNPQSGGFNGMPAKISRGEAFISQNLVNKTGGTHVWNLLRGFSNDRILSKRERGILGMYSPYFRHAFGLGGGIPGFKKGGDDKGDESTPGTSGLDMIAAGSQATASSAMSRGQFGQVLTQAGRKQNPKGIRREREDDVAKLKEQLGSIATIRQEGKYTYFDLPDWLVGKGKLGGDEAYARYLKEFNSNGESPKKKSSIKMKDVNQKATPPTKPTPKAKPPAETPPITAAPVKKSSIKMKDEQPVVEVSKEEVTKPAKAVITKQQEPTPTEKPATTIKLKEEPAEVKQEDVIPKKKRASTPKKPRKQKVPEITWDQYYQLKAQKEAWEQVYDQGYATFDDAKTKRIFESSPEYDEKGWSVSAPIGDIGADEVGYTPIQGQEKDSKQFDYISQDQFSNVGSSIVEKSGSVGERYYPSDKYRQDPKLIDAEIDRITEILRNSDIQKTKDVRKSWIQKPPVTDEVRALADKGKEMVEAFFLEKNRQSGFTFKKSDKAIEDAFREVYMDPTLIGHFRDDVKSPDRIWKPEGWTREKFIKQAALKNRPAATPYAPEDLFDVAQQVQRQLRLQPNELPPGVAKLSDYLRLQSGVGRTKTGRETRSIATLYRIDNWLKFPLMKGESGQRGYKALDKESKEFERMVVNIRNMIGLNTERMTNLKKNYKRLVEEQHALRVNAVKSLAYPQESFRKVVESIANLGSFKFVRSARQGFGELDKLKTILPGWDISTKGKEITKGAAEEYGYSFGHNSGKLNAYDITPPQEVLDKIKEMKAGGATLDDITNEVYKPIFEKLVNDPDARRKIKKDPSISAASKFASLIDLKNKLKSGEFIHPDDIGQSIRDKVFGKEYVYQGRKMRAAPMARSELQTYYHQKGQWQPYYAKDRNEEMLVPHAKTFASLITGIRYEYANKHGIDARNIDQSRFPSTLHQVRPGAPGWEEYRGPNARSFVDAQTIAAFRQAVKHLAEVANTMRRLNPNLPMHDIPQGNLTKKQLEEIILTARSNLQTYQNVEAKLAQQEEKIASIQHSYGKAELARTADAEHGEISRQIRQNAALNQIAPGEVGLGTTSKDYTAAMEFMQKVYPEDWAKIFPADKDYSDIEREQIFRTRVMGETLYGTSGQPEPIGRPVPGMGLSELTTLGRTQGSPYQGVDFRSANEKLQSDIKHGKDLTKQISRLNAKKGKNPEELRKLVTLINERKKLRSTFAGTADRAYKELKSKAAVIDEQVRIVENAIKNQLGVTSKGFNEEDVRKARSQLPARARAKMGTLLETRESLLNQRDTYRKAFNKKNPLIGAIFSDITGQESFSRTRPSYTYNRENNFGMFSATSYRQLYNEMRRLKGEEPRELARYDNQQHAFKEFIKDGPRPEWDSQKRRDFERFKQEYAVVHSGRQTSRSQPQKRWNPETERIEYNNPFAGLEYMYDPATDRMYNPREDEFFNNVGRGKVKLAGRGLTVDESDWLFSERDANVPIKNVQKSSVNFLTGNRAGGWLNVPQGRIAPRPSFINFVPGATFGKVGSAIEEYGSNINRAWLGQSDEIVSHNINGYNRVAVAGHGNAFEVEKMAKNQEVVNNLETRLKDFAANFFKEALTEQAARDLVTVKAHYNTSEGKTYANLTYGINAEEDDLRKLGTSGKALEELFGTELRDAFGKGFNPQLHRTTETVTKTNKAIGLLHKGGAALKDLSWRFASLSMSAMGVYFSLMGVAMTLQQGFGMLMNPLSDIEGMFKNIGFSNAFMKDSVKANTVMRDMGVSTKDMVEGWKNVTGLQATISTMFASLAASIFKNDDFVEELVGGIKDLFKTLMDQDIVERLTLAFLNFAEALPAIVDGLNIVIGCFETVSRNPGLLKALVIFGALSLVGQPILSAASAVTTLGFVLIETIPAILAMDAALVGWLAPAIAIAAAWEAIARAIEWVSSALLGVQVNIPKPSGLLVEGAKMVGNAAINALFPTGDEGYTKGGYIQSFARGGIVKSTGRDMVPGSTDDTIVAAKGGEMVLNESQQKALGIGVGAGIAGLAPVMEAAEVPLQQRQFPIVDGKWFDASPGIRASYESADIKNLPAAKGVEMEVTHMPLKAMKFWRDPYGGLSDVELEMYNKIPYVDENVKGHYITNGDFIQLAMDGYLPGSARHEIAHGRLQLGIAGHIKSVYGEDGISKFMYEDIGKENWLPYPADAFNEAEEINPVYAHLTVPRQGTRDPKLGSAFGETVAEMIGYHKSMSDGEIDVPAMIANLKSRYTHYLYYKGQTLPENFDEIATANIKAFQKLGILNVASMADQALVGTLAMNAGKMTGTLPSDTEIPKLHEMLLGGSGQPKPIPVTSGINSFAEGGEVFQRLLENVDLERSENDLSFRDSAPIWSKMLEEFPTEFPITKDAGINSKDYIYARDVVKEPIEKGFFENPRTLGENAASAIGNANQKLREVFAQFPRVVDTLATAKIPAVGGDNLGIIKRVGITGGDAQYDIGSKNIVIGKSLEADSSAYFHEGIHALFNRLRYGVPDTKNAEYFKSLPVEELRKISRDRVINVGKFIENSIPDNVMIPRHAMQSTFTTLLGGIETSKSAPQFGNLLKDPERAYYDKIIALADEASATTIDDAAYPSPTYDYQMHAGAMKFGDVKNLIKNLLANAQDLPSDLLVYKDLHKKLIDAKLEKFGFGVPGILSMADQFIVGNVAMTGAKLTGQMPMDAQMPTLDQFFTGMEGNRSSAIPVELGKGINSFASGGDVPVRLSNGELYLPPAIANRIGKRRLDKMRKLADDNVLSRKDIARIGGLPSLTSASVIRGPGSATSDSIYTSVPGGSYILDKQTRDAWSQAKGFAAGGSPSGQGNFGASYDFAIAKLTQSGAADRAGESAKGYQTNQLFLQKDANSTAKTHAKIAGDTFNDVDGAYDSGAFHVIVDNPWYWGMGGEGEDAYLGSPAEWLNPLAPPSISPIGINPAPINLAPIVAPIVAAIQALIAAITTAIAPIVAAIAAAIAPIVAAIAAAVAPIVAAIQSLIAAIPAAIVAAITAAVQAITAALNAISSAVITAIATVAALVTGLIDAVTNIGAGIIAAIGNMVSQLVAAISVSISTTISTVAQTIVQALQTINASILAAVTQISAAVSAAIIQATASLIAAISQIPIAVTTLGGIFSTAIQNLGSTISNALQGTGSTIVAAITSGLGSLVMASPAGGLIAGAANFAKGAYQGFQGTYPTGGLVGAVMGGTSAAWRGSQTADVARTLGLTTGWGLPNGQQTLTPEPIRDKFKRWMVPPQTDMNAGKTKVSPLKDFKTWFTEGSYIDPKTGKGNTVWTPHEILGGGEINIPEKLFGKDLTVGRTANWAGKTIHTPMVDKDIMGTLAQISISENDPIASLYAMGSYVGSNLISGALGGVGERAGKLMLNSPRPTLRAGSRLVQTGTLGLSRAMQIGGEFINYATVAEAGLAGIDFANGVSLDDMFYMKEGRGGISDIPIISDYVTGQAGSHFMARGLKRSMADFGMTEEQAREQFQNGIGVQASGIGISALTMPFTAARMLMGQKPEDIVKQNGQAFMGVGQFGVGFADWMQSVGTGLMDAPGAYGRWQEENKAKPEEAPVEIPKWMSTLPVLGPTVTGANSLFAGMDFLDFLSGEGDTKRGLYPGKEGGGLSDEEVQKANQSVTEFSGGLDVAAPKAKAIGDGFNILQGITSGLAGIFGNTIPAVEASNIGLTEMASTSGVMQEAMANTAVQIGDGGESINVSLTDAGAKALASGDVMSASLNALGQYIAGDGTTVLGNAIIGVGEVIGPAGEAVGVTIDAFGQVMDTNGNKLALSVDSTGNIINENNEKVGAAFVDMTDAFSVNGAKANEAIIGMGVGIDESGKVVKGYITETGKIIDTEGKYLGGTLTSTGQIVDKEGKPIGTALYNTGVTIDKEGKPVGENLKKASESVKTGTRLTDLAMQGLSASIWGWIPVLGDALGGLSKVFSFFTGDGTKSETNTGDAETKQIDTSKWQWVGVDKNTQTATSPTSIDTSKWQWVGINRPTTTTQPVSGNTTWYKDDNGYWTDGNGNKYTEKPNSGNKTTRQTFRDTFDQGINEKLGRDDSNLIGVWKDSVDPIITYLKQYAGDNRTIAQALEAGFAANDSSKFKDTIDDFAGWIQNSRGLDYTDYLSKFMGSTKGAARALSSMFDTFTPFNGVIDDSSIKIGELAKEFGDFDIKTLSEKLNIDLVSIIDSTQQNWDEAAGQLMEAIRATGEGFLTFNSMLQEWQFVPSTIVDDDGNEVPNPLYPGNGDIDGSHTGGEAIIGVGTKYDPEKIKAIIESLGYSVGYAGEGLGKDMVDPYLLSIKNISDAEITELIHHFSNLGGGLSFVQRPGISKAFAAGPFADTGDTLSAMSESLSLLNANNNSDNQRISDALNNIYTENAESSTALSSINTSINQANSQSTKSDEGVIQKLDAILKELANLAGRNEFNINVEGNLDGLSADEVARRVARELGIRYY